MKHNFALQEITKKLDEIKEVWQIYEIFETQKKQFEEEYEILSQQREALIKNSNEISAKNALLLSQNKELEIKNKELEAQIAQKNKIIQEMDCVQETQKNCQETIPADSQKDLQSDFLNLQTQCENIHSSLSQLKITLPPKPVALERLEVSYQNYQKLLAKPANSYVLLSQAQEIYEQLENLIATFKSLDLETSKILLEIRDLKDYFCLHSKASQEYNFD